MIKQIATPMLSKYAMFHFCAVPCGNVVNREPISHLGLVWLSLC